MSAGRRRWQPLGPLPPGLPGVCLPAGCPAWPADPLLPPAPERPRAPARACTPSPPRLIPQTKGDLKSLLRGGGSKPYEARLADMHLLLWLSKQPGIDPGDVVEVCAAVKGRAPLLEGYRVIIDSLAGL